MKKIGILLILLALLGACSTKSATNDSHPDDFKVAIAGTTYEMPIKVSKLIEDDWTTKENLKKDLSPDDSVYEVKFTKDKKSVVVNITNLDWTGVSIGDAYVTEIIVGGESYEDIDMASIVLADSTTIDSAQKDIFETFNLKKSEGSEYGGNLVFMSITEYYKTYRFNYDKEGKKLESIIIENRDNTEIRKAASENFTFTQPDYIKNYTAPTAMGASWTDGIFMLDGKLVNLRMPVQALFDMGWEIIDGDEIIAAESTGSLELKNGKKELDLTIYNADSQPQTPENTLVQQFEYYSFTNENSGLEFVLANGITQASTYDEAGAILGEEAQSSEDTILFLDVKEGSLYLSYDESGLLTTMYYEYNGY